MRIISTDVKIIIIITSIIAIIFGYSQSVFAADETLQRIVLEVDIPNSIAVLPVLLSADVYASGNADTAVLQDVRVAIHNHISSLPFALIKPYVIDQHLQTMQEEQGVVDSYSLALADVCRHLQIDGVLQVEIIELEKVYMAAYASYTVGLHVRLYSLATDSIIWEATVNKVERSGGISLSPLGILATAINSATILTDNVRMMLIYKIGKEIAKLIPIPKHDNKRIAPPVLEMVMSNAAQGPFGVGEEIRLFFASEPGLTGTFSLGVLGEELALQEKEAGKYHGRYIVQTGDDAKNIVASIHVLNPETRAVLDWQLQGQISVDTKPPPAPINLKAWPVRGGMHIEWDVEDKVANAASDIYSFIIERAVADSPSFKLLPATASHIIQDHYTQLGTLYRYRVSSIDMAGNRSTSIKTQAIAIAPGPTKLPAQLDTNMHLYAFGSPYILDGTLQVLPQSELTMEAGARIQCAAGSHLQVLGSLNIQGSDEENARIGGKDWRISLSGKANNLKNLHLSGGILEVQAGVKLTMEDALLTDMYSALFINNGEVKLQRVRVRGARQGIVLQGGTLKMEDVHLEDNDIALDIGAGGLQWRAVVMARNRIHVRSSISLRVPATFLRAKDFEKLQKAFAGLAYIDWSDAKSEVAEIRQEWIAVRIRRIARLLATGKRKKANKLAQRLGKASPGRHTYRFADVLYTLAYNQYPDVKETDAPRILEPYFQRQLDTNKHAGLWLQEVILPARQHSMVTPNFLLRQASLRQERDYIHSRIPSATPEQHQHALEVADVMGNIMWSTYLYHSTYGHEIHAWVLHIIRRQDIDRALLLAGILKRADSPLSLALLASGNPYGQQMLRKIFTDLQFPLTELGQGVVNNKSLQRAATDAKLLVHIKSNAKASETGLESSLQRVEGSLQIKIYRPPSSRTLYTFSAAENAIAFDAADGKRKVFTQALDSIRASLLDALFDEEARLKAIIKAEKEAKELEDNPIEQEPDQQ
ncbi:MAG: hypothetical protein R8K21_05240 [Mariprofundales bacterium]